VNANPYPQCEVVQSPVMPVTPVDAEALMTLQGLINRDSHALDDERSKWRLKWYAEKLANAAKISFAERALQQDQIQFLLKVNNEAKVRRATKSLVLGEGKGDEVRRPRGGTSKACSEREGQNYRGHRKRRSKAEECGARGRGSHRRQGKARPEAQEARTRGRGSHRGQRETRSEAQGPSTGGRGRSVRTEKDSSGTDERRASEGSSSTDERSSRATEGSDGENDMKVLPQ
jgi:hypothetical protein